MLFTWNKFAFAASVVVVAGVAALRLPQPLHGDTALFLIAAEGMAEGKFLYKDFWDIKPPGLFLFYFAAGTLFDFSDVGVRLFEAIYYLSLLPLVVFLARPYLVSPLSIFLLPILTTGSFYAIGSSWFLGQAEAITSPLYIIAALSVARLVEDPNRAMRFAAISGLATGLSALMKPVFVIVPIICWLEAAVFYWRQRRVIAFVGLSAVGTCISLLPYALVFSVFLFAGELEVLLTVLLVEPFEMAASWGPNWSYLKISLKWIARFAPALILALYFLWSNKAKRLTTLTSIMIGCGLGIGLVIAVQPQSWWPYHFVPIIFVIGVLVVLAIESQRIRRSTKTGTILLLLLSFAPWYSLRSPISTYISHGIPTTVSQKINYQITLDDIKSPIARCLKVSEPLTQMTKVPREIFVFGNPLIYYLSGTLQAVRMNGWWPENFSNRQWSALVFELQEKLPELIYVNAFYETLITWRSAKFRLIFNTCGSILSVLFL